jgi:cell division septal protein FtsQ
VIPVDGAVSIPAAEIVQASGLAGIHVFAADPNQAASQITNLPGVISAAVELEWPNLVSIAIQEDSPRAIWQEGDQQFWITQQGRLFPARANVDNLLVIESEMPLDVGAEDVPVENPQASLEFVPRDVLAGALTLRRLRPNIDKLYYRPSNGLSYQDGRGWRVYFGTGTDMEQKIAVYETVVAELSARDLTPSYISVSNQEKPYYMAR